MLLQLLFLLPVFILLVFLFMLGGVFLLATLTWSMLCVAWGTLNLNENEPRQQWRCHVIAGEGASVRACEESEEVESGRDPSTSCLHVLA